MPELPEVETVVRDLRRKTVGRSIVAVWTDWPKMIKDAHKQDRLRVSEVAVAHFQKEIIGRTIERVERRGKNILVYLSGDHLMLVHQKMTGHFLVGEWRFVDGRAVGVAPREIVEDSFNHYVHLILKLSPAHSSGRGQDKPIQLGLSDVRKFAKVLFGERQVIEALPELGRLGPDALSPKLTREKFKTIIAAQKRPIKQVLMDPFVVAGIGNIYSDDILWRAQVHPKRRAVELTGKEIAAIFSAMKTVLVKAVRLRGTSTSDFRDTDGREGGYTGHRLVYQRTGEPCGRCKTKIERMVIGGRSAHFCPRCQKFR